LAPNIYFDLLFRLRNSSLDKIILWVDVQICYFFYKNVTFGVTIFLYEAFASFSGKPAYNDWFLSLYNVFFTSLPVIALGVFDQDVSARLCIQVRQYLNSFGN
jgi:magnesium-transporting ATPase (P-type)